MALTWKSRAEAAEAEVERLQHRLAGLAGAVEGLCMRNCELVMAIKDRDCIISDLQDRLAALEDAPP